MNSISTEQDTELHRLLDLLAESVAKRLVQKKTEETGVNPELINEIVSAVITESDFQSAVEDQAYNAVRNMTFHVEVD